MHIPQGRFSEAAVTNADGELATGSWKTVGLVVGAVVVVLIVVAAIFV